MAITKSFIVGCLQSCYDVAVKIIFRKKPKVIFAAPQHFNRAVNGKNPYLEQLVSICKENDISYIFLESPEYGAPQPRDPEAVRADVLFWLMTLLNKIGLRIYRNSKKQTHKFVAKTVNCLTFGKLKANRVVTMAGLFIEMFQEMCPKSTVYDLQHGVIYGGHPGYFDSDGGVSQSLSAPNCKILLWGEGFKDHFVRAPKVDADNKVKIIGYPIVQKREIAPANVRNTILFSLQFTHDIDDELLQHMKKMLDEALAAIDSKKYKVLLKHHPRFNDSIDLSDIALKYPEVFFTDVTIESLVSECILNITWSSTTCFEYAAYGIPTFLLSDSCLPLGFDIFYSQFQYPVFKGKSLTQALDILDSPRQSEEISESVSAWYKRLYSPCDVKVVKSVLGIINE